MIRVAVVDDSATARRYLTRVFSAAGDFKVVGEAKSRVEAESMLMACRPDVVSLDVFLPDGNAAQVVRALMAVKPVPIVLVSDAPRSTSEVFEALAAGALDLLAKPRLGNDAKLQAFLQLVRMLSKVKVRTPRRRVQAAAGAAKALELVAVGASTGGPGALRDMIAQLPHDYPVPIVVAQHLAAGFEPAMAQWLQATTSLKVQVAVSGAQLQPGLVLLGPSGQDIVVTRDGYISIDRAGPGTYHPSADTLFSSAARWFGNTAIGVVLSGIGEDGVVGARALIHAGAQVLAQDRDSSAVYGMPGAVAKAGVASTIGSPQELARVLLRAQGK
jgi:two-component system chemotaxis response regulator CheB